MSKGRKFAVFILSNGRADNVKTLKTLERTGYTGKTVIVVDNLDKQKEKYKKNFDHVYEFDKHEAYAKTDTMDNGGEMRCIIFARNMCHDIAKELGLTHFLVLDDDYVEFSYRRVFGDRLRGWRVLQLDKAIEYTLDYLDEIDATTIAWAQGGDLVGGAEGMISKPYKRKAMNAFFCRTDKPFLFNGTINEDVNTYTLLGSRGHLFLTITDVVLNQLETQSNEGGMTGLYQDNGTYMKSFYTVIGMPSAARIGFMGNKHKRLHHTIAWNKCVPKIIHQKYKK